MQLNLTADEAETLRDMIGDDEPQAIVLFIGEGHSGHGLYASSEDYPEEGSVRVTSLPVPNDAEERLIKLIEDIPNLRKQDQKIAVKWATSAVRQRAYGVSPPEQPTKGP
jgi:hypothetical protein